MKLPDASKDVHPTNFHNIGSMVGRRTSNLDLDAYVILTLKRIRMLKIGDAYEWCYTVVCISFFQISIGCSPRFI